MVESLWQPIRFLDWIHLLRDHELEHSIKELQDVDDKWEPFEESDIIQDSLYCSRISVNMTPVKKQLNESLSQFSVDASFLDSSTVDHTSESIVNKRREDIHQCLIQMELASKTLKGLCHQYESREISGKVTQALDKVQIILQQVKATLEVKSVPENSIESEMSNVSNPNNTVIEKIDIDKSDQSLDIVKKYCFNSIRSPGNSNLRSTSSYFNNDNVVRSVRFNIK
jgi:hypothetical protein